MLLILSGCAHDKPLPQCEGAAWGLNADKWIATAADLKIACASPVGHQLAFLSNGGTGDRNR